MKKIVREALEQLIKQYGRDTVDAALREIDGHMVETTHEEVHKIAKKYKEVDGKLEPDRD